MSTSWWTNSFCANHTVPALKIGNTSKLLTQKSSIPDQAWPSQPDPKQNPSIHKFIQPMLGWLDFVLDKSHACVPPRSTVTDLYCCSSTPVYTLKSQNVATNIVSNAFPSKTLTRMTLQRKLARRSLDGDWPDVSAHLICKWSYVHWHWTHNHSI